MAKVPLTPAVRFLREKGVAFLPREYDYQEHGGTKAAAGALKVDEHTVVKTLVMADESDSPLVVLMHGDKEVSTKTLARLLGVKEVTPGDPAKVTRLTGFQVGGVSPFGLRRNLPIYVEETILDLPLIRINGGKRGLLVEMDPAELKRTLNPIPIRTAR